MVEGLGNTNHVCTHRAILPAAREDGKHSNYCCALIPGEVGKSPMPPLFVLDDLEEMNADFGARSGLVVCVPKDKDDEIQWPAGTTFKQAERAPSGHWLLIISHWKRLKHHSRGASRSFSELPSRAPEPGE